MRLVVREAYGLLIGSIRERGGNQMFKLAAIRYLHSGEGAEVFTSIHRPEQEQEGTDALSLASWPAAQHAGRAGEHRREQRFCQRETTRRARVTSLALNCSSSGEWRIKV